MVFNSYSFILAFLPISCLVYFTILRKGRGAGTWWLVAISLFFYYYERTNAIWLLPASILFNFGLSHLLVRKKSKLHLGVGIAVNIAVLSFFKYQAAVSSGVAQLPAGPTIWSNVGYPLGISFFTFSQISHLVDTYRDEDRPASFADYALFVTFFPHLLAGPILRHREMIPQFRSVLRRRLLPRNFARGIALITLGLAKKVLIADSLAPLAAKAFDSVGALDPGTAWLGATAYTFQLYNDFSGYCDVALGAALLFNIRIPENFRAPYRATSIQEFWRRWHISLSNWLRDYVYFALPGARSRHRLIPYANAVFTMLVCGLWHGFGWTFVLWGLLHGLALAICAAWRRTGWYAPKLLGWVLTFTFVSSGWVVFRSTNLVAARRMFGAMFSEVPVVSLTSWWQASGYALLRSPLDVWVQDANLGRIALLAAVLLLVAPSYSFALSRRMKPTPWVAGLGAVTFAAAVLRFSSASEFLYYFF